jgi:hypothetical protein
METTTDSLPFLDVSVRIGQDGFTTQVYRKPTNTGMLMNFNCTAPMKWKKSLIKCLLTRAYRLSSTHTLFTAEVETIRKLMKDNSYPSTLFEKILDEFSAHHDIDNINFKTGPEVKHPMENNSQGVYLVVPFFGKSSLKFQRRVRNILAEHDIAIRVAYTTTKVGSYFSLKTRSSYLFNSKVVYRFTCSLEKNTSYIGETNRQLFRRIEEHREGRTPSAIFDHLYQCTDCQNVPNISSSFEILHRCSSANILSTEALSILQLRPTLNIQMGPGRGARVSSMLYR